MKLRDDRLIAEFMGWTLGHPNKQDLRWAKDYFDENGFRHAFLPFSDSWDWLMHVIIKIVTENDSAGSFTSPTYMSGNNKYTFEILPDQKNGVYAVGDTMFEAAYTAVVEFIKNNQSHEI